MGVEPTNRFLDGYSLANCWLTIRRTPPSILTLSQKTLKVNLTPLEARLLLTVPLTKYVAGSLINSDYLKQKKFNQFFLP